MESRRASPVPPRPHQQRFFNLCLVFSASIVIFLLPSLLDGGVLLGVLVGSSKTPFKQHGSRGPDPIRFDPSPDQHRSDVTPADEFTDVSMATPPGRALDRDRDARCKHVLLGPNFVPAPGAHDNCEDEIDKFIDGLDLTPPPPPINAAENPDLDPDMGLGEMIRNSKSDMESGDAFDEAITTDVIPGDDSKVARPKPRGLPLPSTAGFRREGLGRLFAPPEVPPPLLTQPISGYDWPSSNITARLDALEPAPDGMDAQVWRDFRPWRGRGFTMDELRKTRARNTVLLTPQTEYSHEIFTTVVKDGVPYYLVGEMKQLSHYKIARLVKLLDFVLQLHSVGKQYTLPDVYLVWTVLPNPLLRARNARDLVVAPTGECNGGGVCACSGGSGRRSA